VAPQLEAARLAGQGGPVDQLRPRLGERPLAQARKPMVELGSDGQLDDGIAQELQPLVVVLPSAVFMGHGRMGQGQGEERRFLEPVAQCRLEVVEIRHGMTRGQPFTGIPGGPQGDQAGANDGISLGGLKGSSVGSTTATGAGSATGFSSGSPCSRRWATSDCTASS